LFNVDGYNVGVARSKCLECKFEKHTQGPVMTFDKQAYDAGKDTKFEGVGHCSVVRDDAGDSWMLYHGWLWHKLNEQPGRVLLMDKVVYGDDGWPVVG